MYHFFEDAVLLSATKCSASLAVSPVIISDVPLMDFSFTSSAALDIPLSYSMSSVLSVVRPLVTHYLISLSNSRCPFVPSPGAGLCAREASVAASVGGPAACRSCSMPVLQQAGPAAGQSCCRPFTSLLVNKVLV